MKETKSIDAVALLNEAKISENKESYVLLDKKQNCRVGVGAEIAPSGQPSFFFEILVYLCFESTTVNLSLLEKNLLFLRSLKAKGYSILCQDSNSISCQKIVGSEELAAEYESIKVMLVSIENQASGENAYDKSSSSI